MQGINNKRLTFHFNYFDFVLWWDLFVKYFLNKSVELTCVCMFTIFTCVYPQPRILEEKMMMFLFPYITCTINWKCK